MRASVATATFAGLATFRGRGLRRMSPSLHRTIVVLAAAVSALVLVPAAAADGWLPHPADATWTYEWTDSVYNPTPTKEKVTVKEQKGNQFTLAWTTQEQGNDPAAPVSLGLMAFQESASGLVNTDWSSNLPPPDIPDPLRVADAMQQQYCQHVLPADLGNPCARVARAAPDGHPVDVDGRCAGRRVERVRLRRYRARHGAGVPRPGARREGAERGDPGRRHRRSLRQRCPDRLVGLRSRPGEDRLRALGQRFADHDLCSHEHQPDARRRRRPIRAGSPSRRVRRRRSAGRTRST